MNIDGFFPFRRLSNQYVSNNPSEKPATRPVGPTKAAPNAVLIPKVAKFFTNFPADVSKNFVFPFI